VVPFANGFDGIFCRSQAVKDSTADMFFVGDVWLQYLNLDAGVQPSFYIVTAQKNTAVAIFSALEVQFKDEISVAFFCPDVTMPGWREDSVFYPPRFVREYGIGQVGFKKRRGYGISFDGISVRLGVFYRGLCNNETAGRRD
jgi:hypothetical protein